MNKELQPKEVLQLSELGEIPPWEMFNQVNLMLRQVNDPLEALRLLAQILSQMGFSVFVATLYPDQAQIQALFTVPAHAPSSFNRIHPQEQTLISCTEFLPTTINLKQTSITYHQFEAHTLTKLPTLPQPHNSAGIIAPLHIEEKESYFVLVLAETLTAADESFIAAYTNLALMRLEHLVLRQEAEDQKTVAQTLQEVSRIVSSSLDLNIVLSRILEQLARVIPYNSAAILLESDNLLKIEAGRGFQDDEEVVGITVEIENNLLYKEIKTEKKPIIINDVRNDARYTLWGGTEKIRAWIGVPLILRDHLIGQISIDSFTKDAFQNADGNLAFSFAQHVSTAIQNARLFQKTVQTTDELSALLDGMREATSTFDTHKIITSTAKRLQELMQASSVSIYMLNTNNNTAELDVSLEIHQGEISPLAAQAVQKIAFKTIDTKRGLISHTPNNAVIPNLEKYMAAPLTIQDTAIGAIALCRHSELDFQDVDLDLLTRFALQTAITIQNSRLYAQLERRFSREASINQLSRRMSSKLSVADLAQDIMFTAKHISEANAVIITLPSHDYQGLYLQYSNELPLSSAPLRLTLENSMAVQAITEQVVIVTDKYPEELYANQALLAQVNIVSAIAVPITTGDKSMGAMELFSFDHPFTYSGEIIGALEYVGRQTGVAIENALLFQQVNDYALTLEERVKERTAEIQQQKDQMIAILEGAADAIYLTQADGTIEYVNPAFTKLTGYSPEEIIGKNPRIFQSGQTLLTSYRKLWASILEGNIWRGELKNKRKDGSIYEVDLTISPIFTSGREVDKFVAIQRDVSKVREVDRLKTEFLATAAHELKTPITTILGYAELLLNREFAPEESKAFLGYIHEQSQHLSSLISDLLDVSKIESGAAFLMNPEVLNPTSIFRGTVERWQKRRGNCELLLSMPDELPEIEIDKTRLEQVLDNLISNALKYSPNGGKVLVQIAHNRNNLRFTVQDQGLGMTIEEQRHVFERFWRADSSSTAIEGTGLGLVIVKHIIESHGGKIWLTSQKGQGTTINVLLPLLNTSHTVLVIEDEPNILEIQKRILDMEGYQVLATSSGKEGYELALSEHPDLIVLDLMLPEINGEEILRRLRNIPGLEDIPVVVVSAKAALTNIEQAFALGAVDFLTKPFDIDEFQGRIRLALSKQP